MARKRRIGASIAGELNLVAMIDVAFQLLSFFLVTLSPVAAMAHLPVMRPQAVDIVDRVQSLPPLIRITVFPDGYTLNERLVDAEHLESQLRRLVGIDMTQGVHIQCQNESAHGRLVNVLDLCAKLKLVNLFVVSSDI